jgi:membrane-bound metal-dependent hydrolase YbcI (DUF457 family)
MSPYGHFLTAGSLSIAYMRWQSVSLFDGTLSLALALLELNPLTAGSPGFCTLLSLGIVMGARIPDWLEFRLSSGKRKRRSFIPHRTLTHYPNYWFMLLLGCFFAYDHDTNLLVNFVSIYGLGICVGALLHLLMDFMTPVGIPLSHPFGKRTSLHIYSTSSFGEWIVVLIFVVSIQLAI